MALASKDVRTSIASPRFRRTIGRPVAAPPPAPDAATRFLTNANTGSGTVVDDISAANNDLNLLGSAGLIPTWGTAAEAKFGNSCLIFQGGGNGRAEGSAALGVVLATNNRLTAEFWVFLSALPSISSTVGRTSTDGSAPNGSFFSRIHGGDGSISFMLQNPATGGFIGISSTTNKVTVGVWNHIALIWDGAVMRVFLNGVQDPTTQANTANYTGVGEGTFPLRLGNSFGNDIPLTGRMDDIRISNIARYTANFTPPGELP